jgi:hypothetical protein
MIDRTWQWIREDKPDLMMALMSADFPFSAFAAPLRLFGMPKCCRERRRRREARVSATGTQLPRVADLVRVSGEGIIYYVKRMLDSHPNGCHPEDLGNALVAACAADHWAVAHLLVHAGADTNWDGGLALRCASKAGHGRMVRFLLNRGGGVELAGNIMKEASGSFRPDVICMLLAAGADIREIQDIQDGAEPPPERKLPRLTAFVCFLLRLGLRLPRRAGLALACAVAYRHEGAAAFLLTQDIDVSVFEDLPLRIATRLRASRKTIQLLMERGANPRAIKERPDLEWLLGHLNPGTQAYSEIIAELMARELVGEW